MSGATDRVHVRLAELVAALSLGVDLGFGQPMEHVLRQCLIALRLAERIGLDQDARATVYYTALLINVGCHSDAHEQARWFGDDIALKSIKYDGEIRAIRAASVRKLGSGNPPLHRFRLGLEFVLSGHRELEEMVGQHAAIARTLAEQLGLPDAVLEAIGGAYEQWDGRGWPGELKGADVPLASRLAQMAEYVEVAHRVGGVEAVKALARKRGGKQFDPALAEPLGRIAVQHRERLDDSGYPRGLAGAAISRPARILAAADSYQAMCEPRPYRPPRSVGEAATELRADVKAGRLDADAVEAVLGAAGHRVSRRRDGPAGLTAREVEVLRLLARGLSNKEVARRLVISPKTVANHIEHIYVKVDVSTRAAASLFAMHHGLLPEEEFVAATR